MFCFTSLFVLRHTPTHTLYLSSSSAAATAWWYRGRVETHGLEPLRCEHMYAPGNTCTHTHTHTLTCSQRGTYSVREHRNESSGSPYRHPQPRTSAAYWAVTAQPTHTLTHTHTSPLPICASQRGGVWHGPPPASDFTLVSHTKKNLTWQNMAVLNKPNKCKKQWG